MDKKLTSIISYVSLIGWLIAYFTGDREGAKFYLNQSLVIGLFDLVFTFFHDMTAGSVLGIIFTILIVISAVLNIMGLVHAFRQDDKPLPLIGKIQILK